VRHHIGYCATRNDTWINGDPLTPAVEALELQELVRQLQDRITPLLRLNTGMGRASSSSKRIRRIAFASTHNVPVRSCSLQHKRTITILTDLVHHIFTMPFMNLLV